MNYIVTREPSTVHVLKNDAALWNVFPDLHLRRSFATNRKASSENWKASSEEAFQRCEKLLKKPSASLEEVVRTYVTSVKLVMLRPRAYGECISWPVWTYIRVMQLLYLAVTSWQLCLRMLYSGLSP